MCGVLIIIGHFIPCHPFAAEFAFNITREDDETAMYYGLNDNTNHYASDGDDEIEASGTMASDVQRERNGGEDLDNENGRKSVTADCFDRRHKFIVQTVGDARVNEYFDKRTFPAKGYGEEGNKGKEKITEIAVRERGTDTFSQVIRLIMRHRWPQRIF